MAALSFPEHLHLSPHLPTILLRKQAVSVENAALAAFLSGLLVTLHTKLRIRENSDHAHR
jgi:hypothetical protein